jgi:hypothetical protein
LAVAFFEAFTASVFGAEDEDCADETRGSATIARNIKSSDFTVSSVLP